jgi:enoyl-CoA hydratase
MPIPLSIEDGVAVLRLELGRGNAIDDALIAALHGALDEVQRSDARAAVLTGKGRVFSGGLDLATLAGFDRPAMERFLDAFEAMFQRVLAFDRPIVAAINGHALAGGCILAMACDLRVMADGPYQIGANEVQLGLPFPPVVFAIARHATPAAARSLALVQGKRFSPAEAHRFGLVHRLAPDGGAVPVALEEARLYAAGGPDAVRAVKADLTSRVLAKIPADGAAWRRRFVDAWFGAEAQARIAAVREQIASKPRTT